MNHPYHQQYLPNSMAPTSSYPTSQSQLHPHPPNHSHIQAENQHLLNQFLPADGPSAFQYQPDFHNQADVQHSNYHLPRVDHPNDKRTRETTGRRSPGTDIIIRNTDERDEALQTGAALEAAEVGVEETAVRDGDWPIEGE